MTEWALKQSDQRLRTLVGNAPVVLLRHRPRRDLHALEGKGLEALGLKPERPWGARSTISTATRRGPRQRGKGPSWRILHRDRRIGSLAFETQYGASSADPRAR
jgi:hypothetical protein